MTVAMQVLTMLYAMGTKLQPFAAIVQPWLEATAKMVADVTVLFYGRSGPVVDEPEAVLNGLNTEEKKELEKVQGVLGRSGPREWIGQLIALAIKYPALMTFFFSFLPTFKK